MRMFICIMCMLHATFAAPQFVTFDNGKVGVNFGGYHAEAGLGGLLTGNAAHGGLSASAGTPWGQQAAAGLGGGVGGRTAGVAYAGAQAIPAVGASAVLGGAAGGPGFAGSEAHANGHVAASSKTISTGVVQSHYVPSVTSAPAALPPTAVEHIDVIQRVKPPKKYTLIRNEPPFDGGVNVVHSKHVAKSVYRSTAPIAPFPAASAAGSETVHVHSGGLVGDVLNIPIGILRSLQESLGGIHAQKTISIETSN